MQENGTVNVFNSCEVDGRQIPIEGTATPADPIYGEAGVFRVQFPGQPPPGMFSTFRFSACGEATPFNARMTIPATLVPCQQYAFLHGRCE